MVKLDGVAITVARFRANSDRANLNCNRNPENSKSAKDEIPSLGITRVYRTSAMKTYKNLYANLCSLENLELAFRKAKKRKSNKFYVREFEANLEQELCKLKYELKSLTYKPAPLKRFIIRDPKTRIIHSSNFRDRVVYHALVNILEPIFERVFINDSYASRLNKGTHKAVQRFDKFKRRASKNGRLVKGAYSNNMVVGYALKADIKHYFETVDHKILLDMLKKKINDSKVIWLVEQILNNFEGKLKGKGMPLGNLTSQFFANVYLNELDYFVKYGLKARYYIRYVDDFVILHQSRDALQEYKAKIEDYIKSLELVLHSEKSKIVPLRDGLTFLGYKVFYYHKSLRKSSIRKFEMNIDKNLRLYKQGVLDYEEIIKNLQGWFGYAMWANTFNLRKRIMHGISEIERI